MPDIHIERSHGLGMARAREVAHRWAAQVESDLGLSCSYDAGECCDRVQFTGAAADGTVEVTSSSFVIDAQLGFLFGAFSDEISRKVGSKLDALLAEEGARAPGPA